MKKVLFTGMRLIDGSGKPPVENASILVENGFIKKAGALRRGEDDATVIDLAGKTVIPGLIDCHVHSMLDATTGCVQNAASRTDAENTIESVNNLRELLSDGVVFFREMGGKNSLDITLRDAVRDERLDGPDFFACGSIISMTGGHCHTIARETDGAEDVIKAVREQIKKGADTIKFMASGGIHTPGNRLESAQLTLDELTAGVCEAHRHGRIAAAHALTPAGIKNAVFAGVDSLEHGCMLDEYVIEEMLKKGIYLVPTLFAVKVIAEASESGGFTQSMLEKAKKCAEHHENSFKLALKSGVKIAFGTDRGTSLNDHGKGSRELALITKYGMTPMEAIVSATKTASELLDISETHGTLEIEKYADFIVLDGNPLENTDAFTEIKTVYKKGVKIYAGNH